MGRNEVREKIARMIHKVCVDVGGEDWGVSEADYEFANKILALDGGLVSKNKIKELCTYEEIDKFCETIFKPEYIESPEFHASMDIKQFTNELLKKL